MPIIIPPPVESPFASVSDLATYLQRDLSAAETATATLILDLVTAAIRGYTGQSITTTTTTARLKVRGDKVRLPQAPVTAVSAVTTTTGTAITHEWFSGPTVYISSYPYSAYGWQQYVDVTYTHGYAATPDDIRAVTLQVAGRAFGATADTTGVQSENIGGYGYSMGAAAAQGAVGFLLGERQVLDRYKVPAGPILMERA